MQKRMEKYNLINSYSLLLFEKSLDYFDKLGSFD